MADQQDVRTIALSLPETEEATDRFAFTVQNGGKRKAFVWAWNERTDLNRPRVPRSDVVAVRVSNHGEKAALLASDAEKFFTEPHYHGFPAVLVRLPMTEVEELADLIAKAWRCQAPKGLNR